MQKMGGGAGDKPKTMRSPASLQKKRLRQLGVLWSKSLFNVNAPEHWTRNTGRIPSQSPLVAPGGERQDTREIWLQNFPFQIQSLYL